MDTHSFTSTLVWTGADAAPFAYDTFSRDLEITLPGRPVLRSSSAAGFLGDPTRFNPEDLILASVSCCHALTFLAVCARARLTVVSYADQATATLAPVDGKYKVTGVTLRPQVVFAAGTALDRAPALQAKAHDNCFIARSVNFPVTLEPTHTTAS